MSDTQCSIDDYMNGPESPGTCLQNGKEDLRSGHLDNQHAITEANATMVAPDAHSPIPAHADDPMASTERLRTATSLPENSTIEVDHPITYGQAQIQETDGALSGSLSQNQLEINLPDTQPQDDSLPMDVERTPPSDNFENQAPDTGTEIGCSSPKPKQEPGTDVIDLDPIPSSTQETNATFNEVDSQMANATSQTLRPESLYHHAQFMMPGSSQQPECNSVDQGMASLAVQPPAPHVYHNRTPTNDGKRVVIVLDDDSDTDSDIEIITPEAAKLIKWKTSPTCQTRGPILTDDEVIFIKEEPREEFPSAPRDLGLPLAPDTSATSIDKKQAVTDKQNAMLKAQRLLLAKSRAAAANSGLANGRKSVGESSSMGAKNKGKGRAIDIDEERSRREHNDLMDVDAAMGKTEGDNDNSWMHEEDNTDIEKDHLVKARDLLLNKFRSQKLTEREELMLYKIESQIHTHERLRAATTKRKNDFAEDQDSLFVPEGSHRRRDRLPHGHSTKDPSDINAVEARSDQQREDGCDSDAEFTKILEKSLQSPEDDEGGEEFGLSKAGKAKKRRPRGGARPKNAKEAFAQEEARKTKARSKAQQKKRDRSKTARSVKKPTKAKASKKKSKKAEKSARKLVKKGPSLLRTGNFRDSEADPVAQMMLDSLMQYDPIADRLQNPVFNRPSEPSIRGKQNKQMQFQQLFANIPDAGDEPGKKGKGQTDKAKLRNASKSFGYAQCRAVDGKWLIAGMKSTLYHHQLLGAQWMIRRELSAQPPNGGLLADSMGLGKTVQTLACMVGNPPGQDDIKRGVRATLIVVPATVIQQWMDEIRVHANEATFPKILVYRSSTKILVPVLRDLDIVVTSYFEVMKQFPYPKKDDVETISRIGYNNWWDQTVADMGVLHQVSWYRIVLDEAQAIKNNNSRTSIACQNLKSIYRWCLTGTPLLNRLEELFPYLRFLRANYSMNWTTFQKHFCDTEAADSYTRISTLLSYAMMRRTMKTTILNRPIIVLPRPHPKIVYVEFSAEEKIIYRITENRFRSILNRFFEKGEARRNYSMFMVQLLRLRQCTSHPYMLEGTIKECWTAEDIAEAKDKLANLPGAKAGTRKPFYEQCKLWIQKAREEKAEGAGPSEEEAMPFGKSGYGHSFSIDKALDSVDEKALYLRVVCGLCSDVPRTPEQTNCGHVFCKECLQANVHERASYGEDYDVCPTCDHIFQSTKPYNLPRHARHADDDNSSSSSDRRGSSNSRNSKRKAGESSLDDSSLGRDELGFEPSPKASKWITSSDTDPNFQLVPSAKTTALKAILMEGFLEAPLDKVVIYCQFHALARIVARVCRAEGWGFLYLTGDSTVDHRNKVIKMFREEAKINILIAGLKCGGIGLNFPWANRCISLDLWWNHAVEQQAFGRIFRIGQMKETYLTRIVVKDSVDMRLLTMQLQKLRNVERATDGETAERGPSALDLKELSQLFGFLRTDANNEILSVEADYNDIENNGGEASEPMEGMEHIRPMPQHLDRDHDHDQDHDQDQDQDQDQDMDLDLDKESEQDTDVDQDMESEQEPEDYDEAAEPSIEKATDTPGGGYGEYGNVMEEF